MSLREKIAQMIISYSDGFDLDEHSFEFTRIKNLIDEQKIGGLIFFKGNSVQEANLINKFQALAETPLLISQDFERGTGMRLDDGSVFPSNMGLGATRNKELAYQMGIQIAKECKAIGVHQNYAPVMDVNNNPDNPIINVRSYGEDPELVSSMGINFIKGLQDGGIIATAKHFPGHGDTDIDTHIDLPVIIYDRDRIDKIELVPFKNAIISGVKSIMTAHISLPKIDNVPNIPASLSKKFCSEILTDELGFNGLKITDALNMAGVTKHFKTREVAVMCVEAGIDLILMPQGEYATIEAIEQAVMDNRISESRIDNSVKKILDAKEWLGLNKNKFVDVSKVSSVVNSRECLELSQKIADESITLVKNETGVLPFGRRMVKSEKCLIVSLNNGNDNSNSDYFIQQFLTRNRETIGEIEYYDTFGDIKNTNEILNKAENYSNVVIPIFAKVKIKTGTVGIPESQLILINKLIEKGKNLIIISLGNPYLIQGFPNVSTYICGYGDSYSTINATIKAMFGDIQFKGKLPVSISNEFKFGTGILN